MADEFTTVPKQKKTKSWKDGWKLMKWNAKEAMEGYSLKKKGESKEKPTWSKGWSFKGTGWGNAIKPTKKEDKT